MQPPQLPSGLIFIPEFLTEAEHESLLTFVQALEFHTFSMHGVEAKRRILAFGWNYSFASNRLTPASPMPAEFEPFRAHVAEVAGVAPASFSEVLVTEYRSGAGIGWHRDAPPFGTVAGISLGATCRMRFRRRGAKDRAVAVLPLAPRSMYVLAGEARSDWEHMIPAVSETRYSITFRTLRRPTN